MLNAEGLRTRLHEARDCLARVAVCLASAPAEFHDAFTIPTEQGDGCQVLLDEAASDDPGALCIPREDDYVFPML